MELPRIFSSFRAAYLRADQRRGDVKGGVDAEADFFEIKVLQQRVSQVAHADDNDPVTVVNAQDVPDLGAQLRHVVAVALLAKFAEAAQVLPDLRGSDVHLGAQRIGADAHHTFVVQVVQIPVVAGKAVDHRIGNLLLFHIRTFFYTNCREYA